MTQPIPAVVATTPPPEPVYETLPAPRTSVPAPLPATRRSAFGHLCSRCSKLVKYCNCPPLALAAPKLKYVETKRGVWTFHFHSGTKYETRDPNEAQMLLEQHFPRNLRRNVE